MYWVEFFGFSIAWYDSLIQHKRTASRNQVYYLVLWSTRDAVLMPMLNVLLKVRKMAKIRNRYNQVPDLTQDTTWESNKNTINIVNNSQAVSPFPADDHKAAMIFTDRSKAVLLLWIIYAISILFCYAFV